MIVGGNGHDGARSILQQDEVPYPNRKLLLIKGIRGVSPRKETNLFGRGEIFRLHRSLAHLGELGFGVFLVRRAGDELLHQWMRGRENDCSGAVDSVNARG